MGSRWTGYSVATTGSSELMSAAFSLSSKVVTFGTLGDKTISTADMKGTYTAGIKRGRQGNSNMTTERETKR